MKKYMHIFRPDKTHVQVKKTDQYKTVGGVGLTRYPLSVQFHSMRAPNMIK